MLLDLNPFPNDKILDLTKLKAFADDQFDVAIMTISPVDRVENTAEKGENAGYQHFSPFPTMFFKGFFIRVVESWDCEVKSQPFPKQALVFTCLLHKSFENCGKRRNCT